MFPGWLQQCIVRLRSSTQKPIAFGRSSKKSFVAANPLRPKHKRFSSEATLSLARLSGASSARRFWQATKKGYPILQLMPHEPARMRTSYSSDFLYTLTTDELRMDGFRRAMATHRAKRVLEIGCGPWAPLVKLSLEASAEHVTAVEASPAHAQMARKQVAHYGDRVQILSGRSMSLPTELLAEQEPELLVAELLGYTASKEGAPAILADVQHRLGPLPTVPKRASSYLAPAQPLQLSRGDRFRNWFLHGSWLRQTLEVGLYDSRNFPEDLHLAEGQLWEDYDFECLEKQKPQASRTATAAEAPDLPGAGGLRGWWHFAVDAN
eukprot:g16800.t1